MLRSLIAMSFAAACGNGHQATIDAPRADAPVDTPIDAMTDAMTPYAGIVTLVQGLDPNGMHSGAYATFVTGSAFGNPLGSNGPCSAFASPPNTGLSAGHIAITGTTSAFSLEPTGTSPNVAYNPNPMTPNPLFAAGATIAITAVGSPDVPTFSTTLVAPTTLVGFTPPTTISRAAGYTATWTAGSGPSVSIEISASTGANKPDVLICRVPDTGSYTVAPAAFALLPGTDNAALVFVSRTADSILAQPNVLVMVSSQILGAGVALTP